VSLLVEERFFHAVFNTVTSPYISKPSLIQSSINTKLSRIEYNLVKSHTENTEETRVAVATDAVWDRG
jgi:hypothetical protein